MSTPVEIAFVDIETAPSLGWTWGPKWETSIIDFKTPWYMLSFAYKFVGDRKVTTRGLIDYPGYLNDKENDKLLVADLWEVFDKADILIGHNGDSFDIRKSNSRFLVHGFNPPTPYRTVDTLKIARRAFKFDSNKLDDLGHYLNVGRKIPHTGFNLWKGCMDGDPKAWKMMKKYNGHDVELLEDVYYATRAWAPVHPNVNKGQHDACPMCGKFKLQARGFSFTLLRKKQRFQCTACAHWSYGPARKVD